MASSYLAHHGIKGQKWGVRRYQDENGRLTPEGKKKYHKKISRLEKKINRRLQKQADLETGRKVTTLRLHQKMTANPKQYATEKQQERALNWHNKQIMRYDRAQNKQRQKINRLLVKSKDLGVDRIAEPMVRKGQAYFVDSAVYAGGYYQERGTLYTLPVSSLNIKLR